jgi:membrane-bound lytic murein transglycosylase D
MPILDKAYPNALLFSVGLLLGSGQTTSTAAASPGQGEAAQSSQAEQLRHPPPGLPRSEKDTWVRARYESEELAALRRAETEMFGQLDDIVSELAAVSRKLDNLGQGTGRPSGGGAEPAQLGAATQGYWEQLRMPTLPITPNARIEKYVRFFTESAAGRKMFVAWLKRSGKYRDIILSTLRENNLPPDLIAVAFIESGFHPKAVSSAGATGLWQFMPKTARAYGLSVGARYDERRSLWRSTDAAARHLTDLYSYFQSWELALAAYNYGYERLASLSERMGTKDFWALSAVEGALPRETVLYVPKVLAVAVVLNNLDRFEMEDVGLDEGVSGAPMQVPGGTRLSLLARAAGTSLEAIRSLNPEFRNDVTPNRDHPYVVHIPAEGLARARVMLPRLLEDPQQNDEDTRVPDGFHWGRDDPDPSVLDRLGNTIHGKRQDDAKATPSYLRAPSQNSPAYFGGTPRSTEAVSPSPALMTLATEPTCSGEEPLASEAPPSSAMLRKEKLSEGTLMPGETSTEAPPSGRGSKRRMKARTDREIIFYVTSGQDTVSSVASRFRVDEGELRNVNRLGRTDAVSAGTLLRVPVSPSGLSRLGSGEAAKR